MTSYDAGGWFEHVLVEETIIIDVIFKSRLGGLDGVSKSAHELVPVRGAAEDWNSFMQEL